MSFPPKPLMQSATRDPDRVFAAFVPTIFAMIFCPIAT
jgi:hypothetical protein